MEPGRCWEAISYAWVLHGWPLYRVGHLRIRGVGIQGEAMIQGRRGTRVRIDTGRCGLIHAPDAAFAYTLCVVTSATAYSPRSPARLNLKHQKQYQ